MYYDRNFCRLTFILCNTWKCYDTTCTFCISFASILIHPHSPKAHILRACTYLGQYVMHLTKWNLVYKRLCLDKHVSLEGDRRLLFLQQFSGQPVQHSLGIALYQSHFFSLAASFLTYNMHIPFTQESKHMNHSVMVMSLYINCNGPLTDGKCFRLLYCSCLWDYKQLGKSMIIMNMHDNSPM